MDGVKTERITFRCSKMFREYLESQAEKNRRSLSEYVLMQLEKTMSKDEETEEPYYKKFDKDGTMGELELKRAMLNDNDKRGFLYGRLLAMYELLEKSIVGMGKATQSDVNWQNYMIKPEKISKHIEKQLQGLIILEKLKAADPELANDFDKEIREIKDKIDKLYGESSEAYGKPLENDDKNPEGTLYGYHMEIKYWQLKKPKYSDVFI